jgi:hypothetical protein
MAGRSDGRPDIVSIALGALDDDPVVRPQAHWHVAFKASWHDIADDLPQHEGFPGTP